MVPLESWWEHAPKRTILPILWASWYIFRALSGVSKQASKCQISVGYLISYTRHSCLLFQLLMPTVLQKILKPLPLLLEKSVYFSAWFLRCSYGVLVINRLLLELYLYCLLFLDCCRWNFEVLPSWYAWEEPKTDLVWAFRCAVTFVSWWARPKLVGSTWV